MKPVPPLKRPPLGDSRDTPASWYEITIPDVYNEMSPITLSRCPYCLSLVVTQDAADHLKVCIARTQVHLRPKFPIK